MGRLTLGLAVGVVNVHVHGPMQGADKGGLIGTLGFMSSVDGLGLPVGPVDILLKQSHGKDVGDVEVEDCKTPRKQGTPIRPVEFPLPTTILI